MIHITILVAFCLVSALITLGLGVFVYATNPRSEVNRLFFAVMLAGTYWAIGEFFIWYPGTPGGFLFWLKASSLWPFAIALMFHCMLALTSHPLSKPEHVRELVLILYAPATIFSVLGLFTDTLFVVTPLPGGGYGYSPPAGSLLYILVALHITLMMIWAIATCFVAWRRAPPGKVRRQNRLIALGVVIVVAFGSLSGIFFPVIGIPSPNTVFIGIVIFSGIITYAILKYGLFTLNPETAVPDLIRMMPDGLILADMDGRIITVNAPAAALLGKPEHDLLGSFIRRHLPETSCVSLRSLLLDGGQVHDYEVVLDPVREGTVSISGSLVKDPGGDPAGFILIFRDITDRKASEKALEVANEKISLLTQLTRHDISNLVTGLDGYLLLLKERTAIHAEDEAYLASCIDIVEKIERQLQFAREYQSIGVHRPVWQPVPGIVERSMADLSRNDITIIPSLPATEIYADPLTVKVFYNILENSLRHGEHVTEIHITAGVQKNRELLIAIEDNGCGVPDQEKERIFRYGAGKNTGLGLALSRDILSVTGIRLIETGAWGKGARFELLVPASAWREL
jgi:PAS domain S-box-containing protein